MKKDNVVSEIMDAVEVLKLNKSKMLEISSKKSSTMWAVVFLIVPFVLNVLLAVLSFPSGGGAYFMHYVLWPLLMPLLSLLVVIFSVSFVAKKYFKGHGEHIGFFRVAAYAGIINWLNVVFFLLMIIGVMNAYSLAYFVSSVAGLWILAVSYTLLIEYHRIKQENALMCLGGGIVLYFVAMKILTVVFIGNPGYMWY